MRFEPSPDTSHTYASLTAANQRVTSAERAPEARVASAPRVQLEWLLGLLALLALALVFPTFANAQAGDPVVIEVDGTTVTQSEFETQFDIAARSMAAQQGLEPTEENLAAFEAQREAFLDQYATRLVLLDEAAARGLEASDEEVESTVSQFRAQFEDEAAFQERIAQLGFEDESALRANVRESLTVRALIDAIAADVAPTPEDVEAWYEAHPEQFQTEDGVVPLEDVQTQIAQVLVQEAVQEQIEDLRAQADVQLYPENI